MERHDVVVIGGGQAGLSISHHLKAKGIEHVVLERGRVGETWRRERWDSFCLVTPNWSVQLPGRPYDGPDPDGFMKRDEIVAWLEAYAREFALPVRLGVTVKSVRREGARYAIETDAGRVEARQVVVAAGAFPRPRILPSSAGVPPEIGQIHTVDYRSPDALPPGAVLVVGSGQSGVQIAEELVEAGRRAFLAVGSCGRAPRRYRGKDLIWWLRQIGVTTRAIGQVPDPAAARRACKPYVSGKRGGHTIYLDELAARGLQLLGRLDDIRDGVAALRPGLNESLAKADAFSAKLLDDIDACVAREGLDAPPDPERARLAGLPRPTFPERTRLDLRKEGITTVVWATGYKPEFPWLHVPVFDADGAPAHERGVTASPGLYFLGLYWLHTLKSDALLGVGEDAEFLSGRILEHHARASLAPSAE